MSERDRGIQCSVTQRVFRFLIDGEGFEVRIVVSSKPALFREPPEYRAKATVVFRQRKYCTGRTQFSYCYKHESAHEDEDVARAHAVSIALSKMADSLERHAAELRRAFLMIGNP